ncbi:MAG: extracellular solute-binding protein [Lachnospiraceae bacterium]|nr:extracellular solute-binding protein [Lachnospiraceae bacterium]
MKRKLVALLLALTMVLSVAACGKKDSKDPSNGELVNGKFTTKRSITVEVYDRDGKTPADNNVWTDWIKKEMLERYNVEVTFKAVPRWTEVDQINNLLAAGEAPDICYTYSYPTILTYANMGGVTDLNPLLTQYKDLLPELWNWLGDENIYYDQDPTTKTVWCVEGRRNNTYRINTFVRQDWLDKLGMKAPTTTEEFEKMLVAFKDNAQTLLGKDAAQMIPMMLTFDVGWTAAPIIESFIDPKITDKELYINGYDDRKFTENGTKEAIRLLNKWYNNGLIWKDFALYSSGDTMSDDLCKAGYVGAFIQNYDYPFRNGVDSFNAMLAKTYGPEAKFVAINCFNDKNGKYTHYSYSAAGDRKAFFPLTNKEPLASLLYLNFISSPEVIQYLQIGEEGINHEKLADGAIQIKAVDEAHIAYNQNSGQNIDLTMTCNGLRLSTVELTQKSLAYTYAEVDPKDVANAMVVAEQDAVAPKNVNVGEIASEAEGTDLTGKRDKTFDNAVVCSVADFDKVWDEGMKEYLNAGGQAIIDERKAAWEKTYGNKNNLD